MLPLQFVQSCFLAGIHLGRAMIQDGLVFRVISPIEVGNQGGQVKALLNRQPCNLLPDFSHAHSAN